MEEESDDDSGDSSSSSNNSDGDSGSSNTEAERGTSDAHTTTSNTAHPVEPHTSLNKEKLLDQFGMWYGVHQYKVKVRRDQNGELTQIPNFDGSVQRKNFIYWAGPKMLYLQLNRASSKGLQSGRVLEMWPTRDKGKICTNEEVCGEQNHSYFSCHKSYSNPLKTRKLQIPIRMTGKTHQQEKNSIVRHVRVHGARGDATVACIPGARVLDIARRLPTALSNCNAFGTVVIHVARQSEVLKEHYQTLQDTARKSTNARIVISGPLPTYRKCCERFSRLFGLQSWFCGQRPRFRGQLVIVLGAAGSLPQGRASS
ncbi:hypothetical protein NFI96_030422 [Prochilodus magdalenae]|nr:hypothetical protein NFI96_030422 [Prochilodus magdalenae]